MRVGYLASQYPAPSHTFIRREIAALRQRGLEIRTFSVRAPRPEERQSEDDRREHGQTWYALPPRAELFLAHPLAFVRRPFRYLRTLRDATRHRVPGVRAGVWSIFHFVEAVALARELERQGVEHLHNHFANSGANVGYLAARYLGLPWSLTLHGISEFDYPAGPLLKEKIEAAAFVACVTHFGRAQAMRITAPDHWKKMFVARCGVELARIDERKLTKSGSGPRLRVVSVGRLSPEKGQHGLLEAFAQLVEAGRDIELRLVGDGPERSSLEAEVARLGLGDRCHLTGRLSEPDTLAEIAQADVFALSSFMEGLPVVIMEALALRVPVVAPCVAGIPELVKVGQTGLLFDAGDWAELADCLGRLLDDESSRRQFAAEGRARIEREYDVARAIEPLLARFGAA